ncbi:YfcC family protein [Bacilliculturomica massiliensis]|uniref:YfcC family protein n=1 Tax=Bacilliculturomica massiliensis TaxID=1917867 RepID=UPI0010315B07|nr:AbgT family transporter [Bacilliculturomica massiliensis]
MEQKKSRFKIPHVYIILVLIIIFAGVLTYIVPAGEYTRVEVNGMNVVDPASFHYIDQNPVSWFEMITAIPEGFLAGASIIVLMFVSVGSIGFYTSTGALERVLSSVTKGGGGGSRIALMIGIMLFFFLNAGLTGAMNTPVVYVPLIVSLCLALGYDAMTGLGMIAVSVMIGFGSGPTNPNTVVVAQEIAELPIYSGLGFRTFCYLFLGAVGFAYVIRYAERVRKDPSRSLSSGVAALEPVQREEEMQPATFRDKLLVFMLLFSTIAIALLTIWLQLGLNEMTALYLIFGVIGGVIAGFNAEEIADKFTEFGKTIFLAVMVIALARAIPIVLEKGQIIDTIIYALAQILQNLPASVNAIGMFIAQTFINFFINSGSGQAMAMMPIMSPLSDLIGVSRQTAILAFQFGDGFSNLVWPTSAIVMAYISAANLDFGRYLKFVLPLFLLLVVLSSALLFAATVIGY